MKRKRNMNKKCISLNKLWLINNYCHNHYLALYNIMVAMILFNLKNFQFKFLQMNKTKNMIMLFFFNIAKII